MKRIWSLILATLPFTQCKTPAYTPKTFEGSSITFGSGGGITGHITCTTLLESGDLFRGTGLTDLEFEALGKVPKAETEQLFANWQTLALDDIDFVKPGNTYQFMEFKKGDRSHRISWGNKNDLPDSKVHTYFQILKNKTQLD